MIFLLFKHNFNNSVLECSTSASTENSFPDESTQSTQSYDEENCTSDNTAQQVREISLEEVNNGEIKKSRKRKNASVPGTARGRPRKALVAMYHSQISGDKNTIKIRIKKSNLSPIQVSWRRFFGCGLQIVHFAAESAEEEKRQAEKAQAAIRHRPVGLREQ